MIPNKRKLLTVVINDKEYDAMRFCDMPNSEEVLIGVRFKDDTYTQKKFDMHQLDWQYKNEEWMPLYTT